MSNTTTRIVTAAVVVPILLALIFYGGIPWAIFVAICMGIGLLEFYKMAEKKGFEPQTILGIAIPVAGTLALGSHHAVAAFSIAAGGVLLVFAIELRKPDPSDSIANAAMTLAGMVYVGFLASHAVLIREYLGKPREGILFVILALAGSMICDAGAYFIGRAYGKRKLIPHISPGKTVEGSIGGLFTGVLGVYLFKGIADLFFFQTPIGWGAATLLGLLLAVAGQVGDLVESMMKRDAGVKDSGNVFPGHGGMLDRLDSPLFTLAMTFYFVLLMRA